MAYLPFGEWRPDADDQDGDYLTVARNVIPAEGSYRPVGQFVIAGNVPMDETALAGKVMADPGSRPIIHAGSANSLYRSVNRVWQKINTGFTSSAWDFEQWGDEVLAISPEEGLYHADIGSGVYAKETAAPTGRHIWRVGDFVMIGAADGVAFRIQWSGFNDRTAWGSDPATQADFQDLPAEYGQVTGGIGGQYPTVFQERAISRLTYVGPPTIFNIDTLPVQKGNIARDAIAEVAGQAFFIAQDGPNIWDGQGARPIANGRFRRWWRDSVAETEIATARVCIDYRHNVVKWLWNSGGLIYAWDQDRASEFSPGASFPVLLTAPRSEAIGDTVLHPSWAEGLQEAGAINSDGYFGTFSSSSAYEATIETTDRAFGRNRRSTVREIWPDVDGSTSYVTLGSRALRASDTLTYGGEVKTNDFGMAPFLSDARFHRARLRMPAGSMWTHAKGLEVIARPTGKI